MSAVHLVVWWLDEFGGMERHVTALALALTAAGRRVTLFSEMPVPPGNRYLGELRATGVRVVAPPRWRHALAARLETLRAWRRLARLDTPPRDGWPGIDDEYRHHQVAPASALRLNRALARAARRERPAAVHVHGCRLAQHRVLQWASARGLPTVYTEHLTVADWGDWHDPAAPHVVAATADVIACVSRRSAEALSRRLSPQRAVGVVQHIVPDPGAAATARAPAGPPVIVAVGRLAAHKGHAVLLDAARRLRDAGHDFRLTIAGGGEALAALAAQRDRVGLGDVVALPGPLAPEAVAALWSGADVAVTASLTEGQPLTVVEAMAHGLAIVATNVGGIPELIEDGTTGLLVQPGDAAALADALARVIGEPGLAARLGVAARQAFIDGGWSGDAATERALAIYDAAARIRAARRPAPPRPARPDAPAQAAYAQG